MIFARDETYQRSNWRGVSRALGPAREPRVLVVPPLEGRVVLDVYITGLRPLPPDGAPVSEVDVATPRNVRRGGSQVARPRLPQPPAPGFRLAERRYAGDYTLLRWRAPRPVRVTKAGVARAATGVVTAAEGLVQPPHR